MMLVVTPSVFVPAVMGAGIVLSLATLLRDLVAQGRRELAEHRAHDRCDAVAEWVERGAAADVWAAVRPARRSVFVLTGIVACVFGVYVTIGTTGNFLRPGGYVNRIAWLWGASLVVAVAMAAFGIVCLVAGVRGSRSPAWVWPLLFPTPLVGRRSVRGRPDEAWSPGPVLAVCAAAATALTVLATWPHVLDPFDRRVADVLDQAPAEAVEVLGRVLGSTELTIALAVIVGLGTLRCRRFALIYVASAVVSLATTTLIRLVVSRPRPDLGPQTGALDSFPSGHMVQITVLAVLLPLAVLELTRSKRWSVVTGAALIVCVAVVATVAMAARHHHATDVIAGAAIGLAVGAWGRLALHRPGSHDRCRGCRFCDSAGTDPAVRRAVDREGDGR